MAKDDKILVYGNNDAEEAVLLKEVPLFREDGMNSPSEIESWVSIHEGLDFCRVWAEVRFLCSCGGEILQWPYEKWGSWNGRCAYDK